MSEGVVITRSTATMSWIDPRAHLPIGDEGGDPGPTSTRGVIIGQRAYRFSNLLEAFVQVRDGVIIDHGFTSASHMYRSPSFLRIPSVDIGRIQKKELVADHVRFSQLVCCGTESPQVIGTVVGAHVGFIEGGLVGPVGAVVGGLVGHKVAGHWLGFPPIWTELELTLWKDGTGEAKLIRHSLFPSVSFYTQLILRPLSDICVVPMAAPGMIDVRGDLSIGDLSSVDTAISLLRNDLSRAHCYLRNGTSYDGVPHQQDWLANGWSGGNPWNIPKP